MTLVQPSPELQVFIRKELNEDVNTRDSALQAIKEWLLKQPHLPDTWDENRLMTFLRGCNFSLERTKGKLDLYFTMRAMAPELFSNRDIRRPELQLITKYANCAPLPGLTKDGRRVTMIRGLDPNFTSPLAEDAFKITLMIGDVRLAAETTGVAGDIFVLDASCLTYTHFAKVTPMVVKRFLTCVEDAYPVKLKEVHVINVHPLINTIWTWIKPMLKEKIRNRVHIHGNWQETLHQFIPKDVLPEDYGGTAGKLQDFHEAWMKVLEEQLPWFKEQENFKADLTKRVGKLENYDELFGLDGSFKKLNID